MSVDTALFAPSDAETEPDDVSPETVCCERCGCDVDSDYDLHGVYRGSDIEDWCEDCIDGYAATCCCCGLVRVTACGQFYATVDDDTVCLSCYRDFYSTCYSCDQAVNDDDTCSDDWGNTYCYCCFNNRDDDSNEDIHDYDYKPIPTFYGGGGTIHYGIELELSTDDSDNATYVTDAMGRDRVYCKRDSSIDSGFELVTHPHTLKAHRELWAKFFANSVSDDCTADKNGMHVHIQRRYLSRLDVQKMVVFMNRAAHKPFVEFVADRPVEQWAKVCGYKDNFNYRATDRDSDRYCAVNVSNSATVEIRIFRGTVDKDRLFANLEFCDALVGFVQSRSCADISIESFVSHVSSQRKTYKALHSLMLTWAVARPAVAA